MSLKVERGPDGFSLIVTGWHDEPIRAALAADRKAIGALMDGFVEYHGQFTGEIDTVKFRALRDALLRGERPE